jgi:hypothetical protein
MADHLPIHGSSEPRSIEASKPAARTDPRAGAAFRALLEKLEEQATGLKRTSETIEKPEDLADAVDRARESLAQAFSIRDQLLEAWRASRQSEPRRVS